MLPFRSEVDHDTVNIVDLPLRQQTPEPENDSDVVRRRLALLESVALFFSVADPALRRLARRMKPVRVRKGEVLVALGQRCEQLLVIEEGLCELSIEPAPGQPVPLLGIGVYYGAAMTEVALYRGRCSSPRRPAGRHWPA